MHVRIGLLDIPSLAGEWDRHYSALAGCAARLLPRGSTDILEVGSGRGQFTIPLALRAPEVHIVAIDAFRGPYASGGPALVESLRRTGSGDRVTVIRGDGLKWLHRHRVGGFQGVLSSEFLPDVKANEMATFFRDCFRVLDPGGTTLHVFLSPTPRNSSQRLVIEADSDPKWTRHVPREWFSPQPRLARTSLSEAGFVDVRLKLVPSRVRFTRDAAVWQLRRWGVRASFARQYGIDKGLRFLELPDWVVLSGKKAS